jgi:hypothetical protein
VRPRGLVSPVLDEKLHHLQMTGRGGGVDRSETLPRLNILVQPNREQKRDSVDVAAACREMERTDGGMDQKRGGLGFYGKADAPEPFEDFHSAKRSRTMNWREGVCIFCDQLYLAVRQQNEERDLPTGSRKMDKRAMTMKGTRLESNMFTRAPFWNRKRKHCSA